MRRLLVPILMLLPLGIFAAPAAALVIQNPVRMWGRPFQCPGNDVINYGKQYVLICASDFGEQNPTPAVHGYRPSPNAYPIYTSADLAHWRFINYVLTPGHFPAKAYPATGKYPGGSYWCPSIFKLGNRWRLYFAAELRDPGHSDDRRMAIFVAWTANLFGGRWSVHILHWSGQFNDGEAHGGLIDPSVQNVAGRLLMVWTKQPDQLWIGQLTANGLSMDRSVKPHEFSHATFPWEDDASGNPIEESTVLWAQWPVDTNRVDVFWSAASTWQDNYAIGIQQSTNPLSGPWFKQPTPLMHSGNGMVSTGIKHRPFIGPGGRMAVSFFVQLPPATHTFYHRYLAFAPLYFKNGVPYVQGAVPPKTYNPNQGAKR